MSALWRKLNKSRWDSSDPDRAPPPLPLNPQSPITPSASRPGTSSAIQSAHAALTEKARDSGLVSHAANSLTKRNGEPSPERSLVKGATHRRMQSLNPGSVRDLSLMIEGGQSLHPRSPEKERPTTPSRSKTDPFVEPSSEEKGDKSVSITPGPSLTPIIRPTVRRLQPSILGENTPPQSATMLALQNMPTPRESPREGETMPMPLANVTNGSTALIRTPQPMDQLSTQIMSLTNIASSLQKEMAQLSRRSRDNATDLLSLKEATHTRDEDIRKSLRDLLHNMQEVQSRSQTRDPHGGALLLENRAYSSSPSLTKQNTRPFSLPRIPSLNSFAASFDRDEANTPSLDGDTPATYAILERIVREMGTKEGQDQLISRLSEVAEKLNGLSVGNKVEELLRLVKSNMEQSLVPTQGGGGGKNRPPASSRGLSYDDGASNRDLEYGGAGNSISSRVERLITEDGRHSSNPTARAAADLISDDIVKIIRTVKDSVAQGGGLTAEVKALVRELRGEVLGMGREIGRRLDEVSETGQSKTEIATKAEINKVVEEGLIEMKQHMHELLREHRRQSTASEASKGPVVDYHEIYNALRTAIKDSKASEKDVPDLQREDVIDAVKEAWENYKPDITVETVGLEKEEILACLQDGLQQYAPQDEKPAGATREEVFEAVVEGMKHYVPPEVETPAALSRDEIIGAVRDCLEEFEFPVAPSAIGAELSKQDMIDAVKHGLESMDLPARGESPLIPPQQNNDEIVGRLEEIMEFMQVEFKAVSEEAKQNVAANGRDTEQVLDATKDGFEKLRNDIEGYVDRASGVTSQEDFMDGLLKSLDTFRDEISDMVAKQSDGSKELIKNELESLRDTVNSSLVPAPPPAAQGANNEEVLNALQEGLGSLRNEISTRPIAGTNEVLDALQEGLNDLRASIDKMGEKPADLTANDEILDALKSGLDGVKSDIDGLREQSKAVATVSSTDMIPTDVLKHDDIKNLEVLITQLRIKVEAMEIPAPAPAPEPAASNVDSLSKDDIADMQDLLLNIQETVAGIAAKEAAEPEAPPPAPEGAATKEDVEAIETILRNTKSRLEELMDGEQAVRKDHVDALEVLILETKEGLNGLTTQLETLSHKEDMQAVESLVTQVVGAFDDMKERHEKQLEDPEKVTKTDVDAVEAVCLDVKSAIEQMVKSDIAALPTKEDITNLETLVREFKELTEKHAETNAKSFEERQAETVGVGERVTDVKTFLEELQTMVKDKLEEGATGVDALSKSLETIGETIGKNATVSDDLKEMFETMKTEFEESKAGVVGAKLETDEKFEQTTDTLNAKIDERINEVITKYDEFQVAMEERDKAGETRDAELEATVVGTKAVAEELKTLIDTLGSTVTDSLEKMEEASKTVFTNVEDMVLKSDDNHTENKSEHAQTRDQVKEAMGVFEGLQGHVTEYNPKILEAVKDVLEVVGQHFEHSKTSATEIEEKISQKIEEAKPEPLMLPPPPEKYDDAEVHTKLDKLVDHTEVAGKAYEQLGTLDRVHQQVVATAAEITAFLAAQTQRIEDDHTEREKSLQETETKLNETSIALERRLAQKDQAEATIVGLMDEEERIKQSIVALKVEQESLVRQQVQLTGTVSSLETALKIRREELHDMESRAEGIERRILEGVMDQSRVLLMAKSSKKARDVMSRKRVPSQKPTNGDDDSPTRPPPPAAREKHPRSAFNMTMNANRTSLNPNNAPHTNRRILSLSQINKTASATNSSSGPIGRSQSVKTLTGAGALRKSSWGGRLNKGYGDLLGPQGDKENISQLKEDDAEDDAENGGADTPRASQDLVLANGGGGDDGASDTTETMGRSSPRTSVYTDTQSSYLGTESYTGSEGDDVYSDPGSEWTESAVGSLGQTSTVNGSTVSGSSEEEGGELVVYDG